MVDLLEQISQRSSDENIYLGDRWARQYREQLATLNEDAPIGTRWQLLMRLAQAELRLGNESAAIERYRQARDFVLEAEIPIRMANLTSYFPGVAYTRLRETQNCCWLHASETCHLVSPAAPIGSNFGDLDNDGFLDFYLGTGYPGYDTLMPSVMYRNHQGKRFADVSFTGGFANIQKGHGVVFADFNNDGVQDVFEQMGGAYPGDRYSNVFYENPGFGNYSIGLKLVGVHSNRSAIGARIRVVVVESGIRRSIFKHVNRGGSFGANPLRQTIGLGAAEEIDVLQILWPTSNITQSFRGIPVDRFIQVVEGVRRYTEQNLKKLYLRGGHEADRRRTHRHHPM